MSITITPTINGTFVNIRTPMASVYVSIAKDTRVRKLVDLFLKESPVTYEQIEALLLRCYAGKKKRRKQ